MLRLSKLTDYGLLLMSTVAAGPPGAVHQSRGLAAAAGLPPATVSKLLKRLQRAGLLVSQRGLHGGYLLARPAAAVTLAEVVAALEGPIALTECQGEEQDRCELATACPLRGTWRTLNRTFVHALAGVTLADVARPARRRRAHREERRRCAASPITAGAGAGEAKST